MRYIGQILLALFTTFTAMTILSFFRHGVIENGPVLLASFLMPIMAFFFIAFAKTGVRSLGWAFILLGLSLFLMPVGLMDLFGEVQQAVNETPTESEQDAIIKGVMAHGITSMRHSFALFSGLVGFGLMLAGLILRFGKGEINTSFRPNYGDGFHPRSKAHRGLVAYDPLIHNEDYNKNAAIKSRGSSIFNRLKSSR